MPVRVHRALAASNAVSDSDRIVASCVDDGSSEEVSFPAVYFEQQCATNSDCLRVWWHVAFLIVFAVVLLSERGLETGLQVASKHGDPAVVTWFTTADGFTASDFERISSAQDFYAWLDNTISLVAPATAGGLPQVIDQMETRALGAIKVRQIRSATRICKPADVDTPSVLADVVRSHIDDCSDAAVAFGRSTAPFGTPEARNFTNWTINPFDFQPGGALGGYGQLLTAESLYPGSGHGTLLGLDLTASELHARTAQLRAGGWIDHHTRVVLVDMVFFSPHVNMLSQNGYVIVTPQGGEWTPSAVRAPFRPYSVIAMPWWFHLAVALLVVGVLASVQSLLQDFADAFSRRAVLEPNHNGVGVALREAVSTYWWGVELLRCLVLLGGVTIRAYIMVQGLGDIAVSTPGAYPRTAEVLGKLATALSLVEATGFLLTGSKLMFYARSLPELSVFTATIERAFWSILTLLLATAIALCAFALAGLSLFGDLHGDYDTFRDALASLLLVTTVGDTGAEQLLLSQSRVAFALFFIAFVFTVKAVLLNLFIAVLTNAFLEVKADIYDTKRLAAVMANDPDVSFGMPSVWETFTSSAIARELRYWVARAGYAICGAPDDDGSEGLPLLQRIRLQNPRIFWRLMADTFRDLTYGAPREQAAAGLRLLGLFADLEMELNSGAAGEEVLRGYTAGSIAKREAHEARRSTVTIELSMAGQYVHGYRRRRTADFVREQFASVTEDQLTAAEWEYLTITVPHAALHFSKGRTVRDALSLFHVYGRRLTEATVDTTGIEDDPLIDKCNEVCAATDALLY